jgi:hypothetical protein
MANCTRRMKHFATSGLSLAGRSDCIPVGCDSSGLEISVIAVAGEQHRCPLQLRGTRRETLT